MTSSAPGLPVSETKLIGLPSTVSDFPLTAIMIECDSELKQDTDLAWKNKPQETVRFRQFLHSQRVPLLFILLSSLARNRPVNQIL
jgi:hypothetical protein